MDPLSSLPGSFPQAPTSHIVFPMEISPESVAVRKSLQTRRELFKRDLLTKLSILSAVYIGIIYLYDCSLLMLIVHAIIHMHLTTPYNMDELPVSKEVLKVSTLHGIIITNVCCVLLHFLRDIPVPDSSGYIYGHHTVEVIGEQQIESKSLLYTLDLVILGIQSLIYSARFYSRTLYIDAETVVEQYDGSQGNCTAARIDYTSALLPQWITLAELLRNDSNDAQRLQRFRSSILDQPSLLDDGDEASRRQYGSMEHTD